MFAPVSSVVPIDRRLMSTLRIIFVTATLACIANNCPAQSDDRENYYDGELILPEVVRFEKLPIRLFLRSEFQQEKKNTFLPKKYVDLFVRILSGDYDNELHHQAAVSLGRVARENLAEPESFIPSLRQRLKATEDINVRRACAVGLAEANATDDAGLLAEYCTAHDPYLCTLIEPRIAAWKSTVLLETWKARLQSPKDYSRTLVALACDGVAAIEAENMVDDVNSLAAVDTTRFAVRNAAARAVAMLSEDRAFATATKLADGQMLERIIATALLQSAKSEEAIALLASLCDDKKNSVASAAWKHTYRQAPEKLVSRIPNGKVHEDSNVRSVVVELAEHFPSDGHCDVLNEMLGDTHIEVRNAARNSLFRLAKTEKKLTDRILANAGDVTAAEDSTWQHLEQAMLLLGQLRHDVYQPNCIALLKHARPEVYVTAAWLLHLMPQKSLSRVASQEAIRKVQLFQTDSSLDKTGIRRYGIQIGFLLHASGYTQDATVKELCMAQYLTKEGPLIPKSRAIAMWALGKIFEGTMDEQIREGLTARVFDDNLLSPEVETVKAASALGMGLLASTKSVDDLRRAHSTYGILGELGKSVSTALTMLGQDAPKQPPVVDGVVGGWPIVFPE